MKAPKINPVINYYTDTYVQQIRNIFIKQLSNGPRNKSSACPKTGQNQPSKYGTSIMNK